MSEAVIADTSCLVLLDKIGHLELLKALFEEVVVTPEVVEEYGNPLPSFIRSKKVVSNISAPILNARLGKGETTAIQLACENQGCLLYSTAIGFVHLWVDFPFRGFEGLGGLMHKTYCNQV
ncbi:MAG: hypothetical protein J5I94_01065 [Phaeodactylibacter sp.]|nr:hypothetical protein [Phaeodactylibacter sp.]